MRTFEEGDPVMIEASDFFRGKRLAFFKEKCKDHDGNFKVILLEQIPGGFLVCVNPDKPGDSIISIYDVR